MANRPAMSDGQHKARKRGCVLRLGFSVTKL